MIAGEHLHRKRVGDRDDGVTEQSGSWYELRTNILCPMENHPVPPLVLDPQRLAALDGFDILDTPAEEGFDDLVNLVALACGVPVALVSLVDRDRQWFKARVGFPSCETDLNSSVCKFVLAEPDILQIPDLLADPRTAANPLVTGEPFIRFYAGAPLRTRDGITIGSLCVIDHQPRLGGLTSVQQDALRRAARQVMIQLDLRRAIQQRDALRAQEVGAQIRRNALLQLGDGLRDLTTIPEMTRAASEIVGRTLGVSRAGFGLIVGDVEFVDIEPDWTAPGQISVQGRHRYDDFGNIRASLQHGEALIVNDVATDPRTTEDATTWQKFDINAFVHMPVRERGRTVAAFIVHDVQPRVWTVEELGFLRNVADRVEVGVARVRAEELQAVLNHELAHRLKNTLAIVQSIASSTLRNVTEREPVEAFERRVLALSRAHDVLMHKSWTAARMRHVMESVLAMQADLDRFALDGPDMDISPQAALSLSLLLHELATNAIKYGALSASTGKVRITWRTEDGKAPTLVLDWSESGGPAVTPPSNRGGFGSKLIRMGLVGTRVTDLRYDPVGLQAEFRAPLADVQVQVH
ncbi:GAF domain-containing protein [Methylobacterium sp. EM32]|uniref:sensor histidine kinase n=1 Tax=Methylobacterium sp. EM32 TaxID=3163481 RepID=UPI0033A75405